MSQHDVRRRCAGAQVLLRQGLDESRIDSELAAHLAAAAELQGAALSCATSRSAQLQIDR